MATEEAKTEAAPAAHASGGGSNKILVILTAVNLLITLGMVGILFMSFKKESAKPGIEDIQAHGEEHASKAEGGKEGKEGEGGEGAKEGGGEHGGGEGAKKKPSGEYGRMVQLEQFTVNLSTPGSSTPKFVRVSVYCQVKNEDGETEFKAKEPQVRNTIIDVLNSKRPSDLATSDQRDYLKDEIKDALNKFLTYKVEGVFFTNFALSS